MASLTAAEMKTAGLRLELSHDLEERYGSVREGFLAVDKNREGYIGLNEFVKLFDLCNLDQNYVERVFQECDVNNNGKISYAEFAARLVRTDYPKGPKSSITSPLTHNRLRLRGRTGKRTGASALKYVKNSLPFADSTTSRETYKAWDSTATYPRILVPALSTLPVLEANNNVVNDGDKDETEKQDEQTDATSLQKESEVTGSVGKLKLNSFIVLDNESKSNASLNMQIFENGISKSVSFNINGTNDPMNAALALCQQQNINPNAHVSSTVVESLAGKIALSRCKEGMIIVKEEHNKKNEDRIELLETKLREATDIVKRLSNALKEMTKGQAVNDRMKQHNQVTPSKKTNVESKIQSSPSLFSPSYVKKPAVKIIIDGEGKAEFLNKNGELVDGTSGTPVSKTITKEVETAKITTSDEVNEGDDQKITNNEDNDVKKVAEVVAENGNKSNMPASNNDKETNDGWKWSNNEKRIETPKIDDIDDNKTAEERLNGESVEVVSSETV